MAPYAAQNERFHSRPGTSGTTLKRSYQTKFSKIPEDGADDKWKFGWMKIAGRGLNDYQRELKENEQQLKEAIHRELGKPIRVKIDWAEMLPVAKNYMTVNDYWANKTKYSIINNQDTVWSMALDEQSYGLEPLEPDEEAK